MIEIYPNLFVGPEEDYETRVAGEDDWRVVHATNEPYHREMVGYKSDGLSADHPEYLWAVRDHRLALNLIDAVIEVDIPREIFDTALSFVDEGLKAGNKVLVHCNQGVSRSASIGLLYLRAFTDLIPESDYKSARAYYEQEIYPPYNPGKAMRYYCTQHWHEYKYFSQEKA